MIVSFNALHSWWTNYIFKKIGLFVLKYGTISGAIGIVIVSAAILYFSRQLPDIESISTYIPAETTKIYSADGVILAELHQEENRISIPIDRFLQRYKRLLLRWKILTFMTIMGSILKVLCERFTGILLQ